MAVMLGAGVRQHAAAAKRDHLTARLIALRGRPVRRTCELFDFFEQLERGKLGMIDREKVINDLQDAVNDDWMWQHADFYALTMQKAIYLLQAQEPVAPDCVDVYTGFDGALERHYLCVACGHEIMKNNRGQTKYCPNCGRAVKWDADD